MRNDLSHDFALWLNLVRLIAAFSAGKIVLHSFRLFLFLRAWLGPLMELRAVVSNLACAYGNTGHRAEIGTSDEFGVLARDSSRFLDRIWRIVMGLDRLLARVVAASDDIIAIQSNMRRRIERVVSDVRHVERDAI